MTKSKILVLVLFFITISASIINSAIATTTAGTSDTNFTKEIIANTWTQKAPMPTARSGLAMATVDGKIYCIGGNTGGGGNPGTNEMYNPETDIWTTKAPMPTHRSYFAIAVYQDKIYCIGGLDGHFSNTQATWGTGCTVNEVYDPATNTWTTKAPMPTARWHLQANVINGMIYLVGGEPNGTLNEAYDPTTDTWITKAPVQYHEINSPTLFLATGDGASATIDNKLYWIGRVHQSSSSQIVTIIYTPENDSWSPRAKPPVNTNPHNAVATAGIWAPKRIYIFDINSMTASYDPSADNWTLSRHYFFYHEDCGIGVANDKVYAIGGGFLQYHITGENLGLLYITSAGDNEQFTPPQYGTVPPTILSAMPQNSTFTVKDSLIFTTNKPLTSMSYSLDKQNNVTFTGNLTLSEVPAGPHNITVYAADTFGNVGISETFYFTVEPEPFPFIIVGVVLAVAAIAVAGLLVYFRGAKQSFALRTFVP